MEFRICILFLFFMLYELCHCEISLVKENEKKEHLDFEDDPVGDTDSVHKVPKFAVKSRKIGAKVNQAILPSLDSDSKNNMEGIKDKSWWMSWGDTSEVKENSDITHAFVGSLSVIIVSELGDKTFFIAAILAMSHPRLTVFGGAMSALAFMHVLAAFSGYIFTYIPRTYTLYASAVLFLFFGVRMLREGIAMRSQEATEELEEVQMDLRRMHDADDKDRGNVESGFSSHSGGSSFTVGFVTRIISFGGRLKEVLVRGGIFMESFTLTFLAEWGDRSQIATVVLATSNNICGVIFGGLLGHSLCTGLAVLGGKLIASKISVKTVTIVGGFTFIVFGIMTFFMEP